jgi:hypothetical protein
MKESLQEQLARLARSGGLQTNSPSQATYQQTPPAVSSKTQSSQSSTNSYEALILEIEGLRTANTQLVAELNSVKANPNAVLSQLQEQHRDVLARLQAAENSNGLLAEDNLRLKHELAELPDKDLILRWREKSIQADAIIREADESMALLQKARLQLEEDRSAFEADLVRLEALDEATEKLSAAQRELAESEAEIRQRIIDSERSEKKFAVERDRLEKLSNELSDLQARVGHFRGIEKALRTLEEEHTKVTRLYEAGKTRIRNLTAEKDQALQSQSSAEANAKKISRDLKDALNKLASTPDGEVIIRSFETVQWLVSQFEDPYERVVPKQVLLVGDGPWPIDNFTELLQEIGFEVWQNGCDADIEVVIVGRENWSESVIDAQIEERDGESLRVYPQELFVMLLAMQADPLEIADPESLLKFVDGHPVFEYLFNQEFPWPETAFEDGPPATISEGFDGEDASSPLYKMGYSVAQQVGLSPSERHDLLDGTYAEETLPWCISDEYMEDWGEANSRKRLRRIAWHLHLMTKRFKRHWEAVARWESDLAWLKRTYYRPIHRFRWPS